MASKTKPVINKMVLINLHITYESGRRTMTDLSKKAADDNDADAKMITTNVKLIPPDKISPFTTALSRARAYYKQHTLPWEDGNWRVVPVTKMQEFKDDLEKLISEAKDEFEKCFIAKYDVLKAAAEKSKGKLKVDFPTKEELKEGFSIEYNVGAIASADDIRIVGIDTAMRKKIQDETEERYNKTINRGLKELSRNLEEAVTNLSDRVGDEDQKGKKYTTFLKNLKDMTATAKELNVTKNEALDQACDRIQTNIANWSPDAIKTSPEVRQSIKQEAGAVKDQLSGITMSAED